VVVGSLCECRPVPQIILPLGGKNSHWAALLPPCYNAKRGYVTYLEASSREAGAAAELAASNKVVK